MAAGALPRLQKTEPWELIQAFVDANDRYLLTKDELRNRQEIQAMKESGEDRRLERGSQLAIDRLSKELALKEPYEERKGAREHGYDIDKLNKSGEITRQNYGAYGAVQEGMHRRNRVFDTQHDLEYAPQQREARKADLLAKEDVDKLAQQRKLDLERKDAVERDEYLRGKREEDLQHKGKELTQQQDILTEGTIKRAERMTPELIKRQEAQQDAIEARRRAEARDKAATKAEQAQRDRDIKIQLQQMKDDAALNRVNARNYAKSGGMIRLPNGWIGVSPNKKLELKVNGTDLDDPSEFKKMGYDQDPFKPERGVMEFFLPSNPANVQQLLQQFVPQGGGGPAPAYQDIPPQRPPETVAPAIPITPPSTEGTGKGNPLEQLKRGLQGGGSDTPNFGVDDLRRGNQSSVEPDQYGSPLDQLRRMVATADPALRLRYASFREPTSDIGQVRPQFEPDKIPTTIGRTTTVEKGTQADTSLRGPPVPDIAAPVTTGTPEPVKDTNQGPLSYEPRTTDEQGRPREIPADRMGTWRKTAAEAPPALREVFDRVGKKHNMNPDILAALTHAESNWNPRAASGARARGIAQFIPETAAQYGVDVNSVDSSVDGAARLMKDNLKRFNGNLGLALAAYNQGAGGPNNRRGVYNWLVNRGGNAAGAPRETQQYVQRITGRPLQWWADRYKSGTTNQVALTQRDVPTPPSRPGGLEGGTTTVAKDESPAAGRASQGQQQADQELPLQQEQERPPVSQLPARRPSDSQPTLPTSPTEVPGTTLRGLPLESGATRQDTKGIVFHHTGDRDPQGRPIKTVQDVTRVLQNRGLGSQYIMDRDGTIHQMSGDESRQSHIMPGQGIGRGLSNANTIGLEILAANDADITPAQVASARAFYKKMEALYPNIRAYSHGEINPHKLSTEGATVVKDLRDEYRRQQKLPKMHKTENPDLFYVDV